MTDEKGVAILNILIADDDDGDRKLMKRALERAGLPCICVETTTFDVRMC